MIIDTSKLRKFVAPEYIFGCGSRKLISQYAKNYSLNKILLVTDKGVQNVGWSCEIEKILNNSGFETVLYSDISANPRDFEVMKGAEVFEEHDCDSIVAIGGGSVMDCAKAIGIVVSNQKNILEFEGVDKVEIPAPPLLCIPTTAGTSADISQFCVILDSKRKVKILIVSKMTLPDLALIDPETTLTMDKNLTVDTGLDALTHAIEAYVSNASSHMTDTNALEAIKILSKNLPKVFEEPEKVELRENMMLGSLYAGLAFSNASLGATHALAHSLGGFTDLSHGLCNSIFLDKVIDYNFDSSSYKYRNIANIFGLNSSQAGGSYVQKDLLNYLKDIKQKLYLDKSLSKVGVLEKDLHNLSKRASLDACLVTNPKNISANELKRIYEQTI